MALSERLAYILDFDTKGAVKSLESVGDAADRELGQVESKLDKVGTGFTKFGTGALAFAGVAGAGLFQLGQDASDLEESINAVQVAYGEAGEAVLALGENSAQAFGLSTTEFNGFAVQFAGFADKIAAGTGQSPAAVVEELTTRVADFASVMNLEVSEAAQVFQSTLAGETEPIRRFGEDISAAAVNAHLLETGMVDSAASITEADKVMGRYSLVMQETSDVQGDFVNTSDGAANSQRILKADLGDLRAEIGAGVLPMMTELIGVLGSVIGVMGDLNDATGGNLGQFAAWATAGAGIIGAGSLIVGQLIKMRGAFVALRTVMIGHPILTFAAIAAGVGTAIALMGDDASASAEDIDTMAEAMRNADTAAQGFRDTLREQVAESDLVKDALEEAGLTFEDFASAIEDGGPALDAIREKLAATFEGDGNVVAYQLAVGELDAEIARWSETLQEANEQNRQDEAISLRAVEATEERTEATRELTDAHLAHQDGLRSLGDAEDELAKDREARDEQFVTDINTAMDLQEKRSEKFAEAAAAEQEQLDAQQAAYEEWRSGIESSFQSGTESVGAFATESLDSLDTFRADLLTQIEEMRTWKDNLAIIYDEAGADVAAFVAETGNTSIAAELVKDLESGEADVESTVGVIQAYLDEIGDGTPAEVGKNLEDMSPEVAAQIEAAGKEGAKEAETARGKVRDEFAKLPNDASSATSGIDDAVRANVSAAGGAAYGAAVGVGDQMASGMESGVSAAAGRVARAAASLVEGAIQRAREAAEIFSPSRRFAREVGEPIAEGVAQGIEDGADQVGAAGAAAIGAAAVTMTKTAERSGGSVAAGWLKRFSEWFHDNGQSSMADAIRDGIRGTRDAAVEQAEKVAEAAADAYERIWDRIDFRSLLERQRRSIGDAEDALADVFERRRDARADRRAGIVSARGGVRDARGNAAEQRAEDTAAIREQRQENRAAVREQRAENQAAIADAKASLNEAVQARKAASRELADAVKADRTADRAQLKSVKEARDALSDAINKSYDTQADRDAAIRQARADLAKAKQVDEEAEEERQDRIADAQKAFDKASDVVGKARGDLASEQSDAAAALAAILASNAEAIRKLKEQRAENAAANKQRIADARQELADAKAVLLDDEAFQADVADAKRRIREAKEDLARSMLDADGVLKGADRKEFRRLMRQAGFSDAQIDRLLRADARQTDTAANVGDVRDAATAQMLVELKEFNKTMRDGPAWMRVAVIDQPQFRKYLDAEMRKWLDEARRKKGKG